MFFSSVLLCFQNLTVGSVLSTEVSFSRKSYCVFRDLHKNNSALGDTLSRLQLSQGYSPVIPLVFENLGCKCTFETENSAIG